MRYLHTLDARQVNEVLAQARSTAPMDDPCANKRHSEIHYIAPPIKNKNDNEQS